MSNKIDVIDADGYLGHLECRFDGNIWIVYNRNTQERHPQIYTSGMSYWRVESYNSNGFLPGHILMTLCKPRADSIYPGVRYKVLEVQTHADLTFDLVLEAITGSIMGAHYTVPGDRAYTLVQVSELPPFDLLKKSLSESQYEPDTIPDDKIERTLRSGSYTIHAVLEFSKSGVKEYEFVIEPPVNTHKMSVDSLLHLIRTLETAHTWAEEYWRS